jgi:ABC-type antimicrobial peptide transport system permease subunit
MALGATPNRVLRLVIGGGMAVTAAGIMVGLIGALTFGRSIRALFWGINPISPLALVTVAVSLSFVSFVACLAPALRAARMDPMAELRHE